MQNRVIMTQSFKITAQGLLLRKLKIIMLATWQKSKPRWLRANKHIKCNMNIVFKVKNWGNLKFPRPNALEQLWWTNSGLKFYRYESKTKFEILERRVPKPQLIPLLSSTPLPPSPNLIPKPINDIIRQKCMHKLRVIFIEAQRIIPL